MILKLSFAIKQWSTGDSKDTVSCEKGFPQTFCVDKDSQLSKKAEVLCPTSLSGSSYEEPSPNSLLDQRVIGLTWSGSQANRETDPSERDPRSPLLYLSALPADSGCQHP